jgi:hypothetical protein
MASNSSTLSEIGSRREDFVDKARTEWIRRLIDTSRRNNLLYFRETKSTLDLSSSLSFDINDINLTSRKVQAHKSSA